MLSEELDKLRVLHAEGALSDEEYEAAKARLLGQSSALTSTEPQQSLLGMTPSTYTMAIHLSQYSTYVVPFAGVIIPIALWLHGRDQSEFVDEHGRDLMNFLISYFIYGMICFILCFVLIGFILLAFLGLAILILPIFAAIAASQGKSFRYPLTLKFF